MLNFLRKSFVVCLLGVFFSTTALATEEQTLSQLTYTEGFLTGMGCGVAMYSLAKGDFSTSTIASSLVLIRYYLNLNPGFTQSCYETCQEVWEKVLSANITASETLAEPKAYAVSSTSEPTPATKANGTREQTNQTERHFPAKDLVQEELTRVATHRVIHHIAGKVDEKAQQRLEESDLRPLTKRVVSKVTTKSIETAAEKTCEASDRLFDQPASQLNKRNGFLWRRGAGN